MNINNHSHVRILMDLLPYLWPEDQLSLRSRVIMAVAMLIMAKMINIYIPLLLGDLVDSLDISGDLRIQVPLALLLAYGAARILVVVFGELRDTLFARIAQHAIRNIALKTFRNLHSLSLGFHLNRQTGGLSRAIDRGTKGIEFLLSFVLFNVLPTIIEMLIVFGILWYFYDWRFAVIPAITIIFYFCTTFFITEWRLKIRRQMNDADNEANTKAVDSLLNFETVKYFGNEEYECNRYDAVLKKYEDAAVNSRSSLMVLNISQTLVINIGIVVVLLLTTLGVVQKDMTVGEFVMVNTFLMQLALPLNFLGSVYREIKQSLLDLETMLDLLKVLSEIKDCPGAKTLQINGGEVTFKNVDFSYDGRRSILKNINFNVHPGKTVAIVGASGAGKSTIGRLLFRFYDVTGGRILIDNQDIRDVSQESLHAAIGIVPQDTVLFNDSIGYNIAYGNPKATESEIKNAADMAQIHDFIVALPDGYNTMVGERGLKLSGGEKQRVAIARTILKKPEILLFDEATSALDTKTERFIQKSFQEMSRSRTTLMIAHRLSTVVDADEILVLEKGNIVERGRHDELLDHGKIYAGMWTRQQNEVQNNQLEANVDSLDKNKILL